MKNTTRRLQRRLMKEKNNVELYRCCIDVHIQHINDVEEAEELSYCTAGQENKKWSNKAKKRDNYNYNEHKQRAHHGGHGPLAGVVPALPAVIDDDLITGLPRTSR